MKKFLFVIAMMLSITSFAQIKSANLTASGLTCSMCSKAIYKSLVKVSTIQDVKVDIKNSGYLITFKQGVTVSLDAVKKAVENAGFSVAALKVTANFDKTEIGPDTKLSLQGGTYKFLNSSRQTIQGLKTFIIVDKNYLPPNEHKKYAKNITAQSDGAGVYHVTLL
jgi:copper chaperone CopZ